MNRKKSAKTIVAVVFIVALAIGGFLGAAKVFGPTVPPMGGASPAALQLTP